MNKFYLIDKPKGLTSFDVLRQLRKILNIRKMWHTGTLDPLATGALLVAIGNYTKLIPYFEKDVKEYEFEVWLDGITPSFDAETPVEYISEELQSHFKDHITEEKIKEILMSDFTWAISQIPPKYSAIKMWWKKALDMVRKGKEFEMKTRAVTIYEIELLALNYPVATLRAKVSAGTYIRSIAFDLWQIMGCGGYIKELRRTEIGKLKVGSAQGLEDFDISQSLNERDLFSSEMFISVDEVIHEKLNQWLQIQNKTECEEWKEYFLSNEWQITNIITVEDSLLKPLKRIM